MLRGIWGFLFCLKGKLSICRENQLWLLGTKSSLAVSGSPHSHIGFGPSWHDLISSLNALTISHHALLMLLHLLVMSFLYLLKNHTKLKVRHNVFHTQGAPLPTGYKEGSLLPHPCRSDRWASPWTWISVLSSLLQENLWKAYLWFSPQRVMFSIGMGDALVFSMLGSCCCQLILPLPIFLFVSPSVGP